MAARKGADDKGEGIRGFHLSQKTTRTVQLTGSQRSPGVLEHENSRPLISRNILASAHIRPSFSERQYQSVKLQIENENKHPTARIGPQVTVRSPCQPSRTRLVESGVPPASASFDTRRWQFIPQAAHCTTQKPLFPIVGAHHVPVRVTR